MSGLHANIQPSSLGMYVACRAYMRMAAPYADAPSTDEQAEGDAAHWLALEYSQGRMHAAGHGAPNGVTITEDMVEGALLWCETVGYGGVAEQPIFCERIHPTDCWGTPDHWRADMIHKHLWNWDYKFGHLFVDAFENYQMGAGYAPGILDMLGINGAEEQEWTVTIGVVQPRSYHKDGPVRTWTVPATDLRALVNKARAAVEDSRKPDPVATPGEHCVFCPARHECKTLQRAVMSVAEFAGTAERVNMPAPAVAAELTILNASAALLEARITGLREQAMAMLRRGERVPGFAVEQPQGRLAWDVPPEDVIAMGNMLGKDLRNPKHSVITPTQAKKLIDGAVIDGLSSRPRGAARLGIDSTTAARKVFGANAK